MKRVLIYLAVNFAVVLTISLVMNFLGLGYYLSAQGIDYRGLLVYCALFGFLGSFISLQMSRFIAIHAMGVQLIDPERPSGDAEAFLVQKVRSLCSQAGLDTLPQIGIYPSPEVNAFATGPSKNRALLAVSAGLLQRMDDRALEGVIGHELSHVANGDMVTMTLLQGVANTFVMFFARIIAFAIDQALRSRDDDRRGGGLGYFGYYLVVMLLETVLMVLASVLIYWVSRRREYAADAGSARLTSRETMIHALESLQENVNLVDNRQASVATLKIHGEPPSVWAKLFRSHPSLEARIQALREGAAA
jgi:heat shock protein HtpX